MGGDADEQRAGYLTGIAIQNRSPVRTEVRARHGLLDHSSGGIAFSTGDLIPPSRGDLRMNLSATSRSGCVS